jgi:hypothetical protein
VILAAPVCGSGWFAVAILNCDSALRHRGSAAASRVLWGLRGCGMSDGAGHDVTARHGGGFFCGLD